MLLWLKCCWTILKNAIITIWKRRGQIPKALNCVQKSMLARQETLHLGQYEPRRHKSPFLYIGLAFYQPLIYYVNRLLQWRQLEVTALPCVGVSILIAISRLSLGISSTVCCTQPSSPPSQFQSILKCTFSYSVSNKKIE